MSSVVASDSCAAQITGVTYTPPGGSPQEFITLKVKSYSITLDKAHSPYTDATLTVATPEIGAVALMDPSALMLRCTITLGKQLLRPSSATQTRTFNLFVRSVKNDAQSGETTLGLSSDEAKLVIDMYAGNAVDTSYRANQASLRTLVATVLESYSEVLYPDVARNVVLNPVPTSTSNFSVLNGALSYASSVVTITSNGAGTGTLRPIPATGNFLLNGTDTVCASVRVTNPGGSAAGYRFRLVYLDGSGSTISITYAAGSSAYQSLAAGGSVSPTITDSPPVGAVSVQVMVNLATTAGGTPASGVALGTALWNLQMGGSASTTFFSSASSLAGFTFRLDTDGTSVKTVSSVASSMTGDADYTITSNLTNLAVNPSFEAATTGAGILSAAGVLSVVTTPAPKTGTHCMKETVTASGTGGVFVEGTAPGLIAATPGQTYAFSIWVLSTVARSAAARIRFYNGSGVQIGSIITGTSVTTSTTLWGMLTVSAVAPAGAVTMYLDATVSSVVSGDIYYWDAVLITADSGLDADGLTLHAPFDGSFTADTHYTYAWTGTANASTSTRTRLDARDPAVLDRQPGVAMWDWLNGLVQTPGYRLFCDENRVWRLVDNSYAVTGAISLTQAINLVQGSDTIDVGQADTDGQGYVAKVQVVYQWIDKTTAANMTAYDSAGTGHGPGIKIAINTPYPGPGFAAAALARLQGREHVLALTALSDLTTTPGNDVVASLPIINEAGKIASVTWTDGDEMTVGTEGLITIPANAWALAVGPWSAATGTWAGATGTN